MKILEEPGSPALKKAPRRGGWGDEVLNCPLKEYLAPKRWRGRGWSGERTLGEKWGKKACKTTKNYSKREEEITCVNGGHGWRLQLKHGIKKELGGDARKKKVVRARV